MSIEEKLKLYEEDGIVGAYYALNRKLNEITGLLNNNDLTRLDLADKNDGSWERVLKLFNSVGEINDVMTDERAVYLTARTLDEARQKVREVIA